jgi:deazaflavin-dependent oxidoreductase (nitroreductase family)
MAKQDDSLRQRLSRANEITISVKGRKSGRTISNPVWFVLEGGQLELLPVQGSDTQWYKNVLKNPSMRIRVGGSESEVTVKPLTDNAQVSAIADKFRAKYSPADVKKYYSKFDVAVTAELQ